MFGEYSEPENSLKGFLFLVPEIVPNEIKQRLKTKFSNVHQDLRSGQLDKFWFDDAVSYVQEHAIFSSEFELSRSGEILLSTQANSSNHRVRRQDHMLASQMYFFAKDCFHTHQHHEATHDALVPLFDAETANDLEWIPKVQHRLFRQIIRFKRYQDQRTLFRASGILAYAEAFNENFKNTGKTKTYRTDELEKSLAVRRNEIQHFDQLRLSKLQALMGWFFSITAFVLSSAVIARLDKEFNVPVSDTIRWTTLKLSEYPFAALALVWFLARVVQMIAFRESPSHWVFVRNFYQLFRGAPIQTFFVSMLLLAAALGILAYLMVSSTGLFS